MDYLKKIKTRAILITVIILALIPVCSADDSVINDYIQKIENIEGQLNVLQNQVMNIKSKLSADIEQINKLKKSSNILSDVYLNLKLRSSRSLVLELESKEKQIILLEDVKRDFNARLLTALNQKEDGLLKELPASYDPSLTEGKFASHKQIRNLKKEYAQEKVIPPPVRRQYDFSVKDGLSLSEIREKQKLVGEVINETQMEIAHFAVIKNEYLTELSRINNFLTFAQTVKESPETRVKIIDENYLRTLEAQKINVNQRLSALNLKTRELNMELANLKTQQRHIANYAMILEKQLTVGR